MIHNKPSPTTQRRYWCQKNRLLLFANKTRELRSRYRTLQLAADGPWPKGFKIQKFRVYGTWSSAFTRSSYSRNNMKQSKRLRLSFVCPWPLFRGRTAARQDEREFGDCAVEGPVARPRRTQGQGFFPLCDQNRHKTSQKAHKKFIISSQKYWQMYPKVFVATIFWVSLTKNQSMTNFWEGHGKWWLTRFVRNPPLLRRLLQMQLLSWSLVPRQTARARRATWSEGWPTSGCWSLKSCFCCENSVDCSFNLTSRLKLMGWKPP